VLALRGHRNRFGGREREGNLSRVPGLGHEAEGIGDLAGREGLHRQRLQLTPLEQRHEFDEHVSREGRLVSEGPAEVDGRKGEPAPEGPEAEAAVLVDVHLAKLEEASTRPEDGQALRDELACQ
jgi:hypothetical protein